jgi:hypothetical protein
LEFFTRDGHQFKKGSTL